MGYPKIQQKDNTFTFTAPEFKPKAAPKAKEIKIPLLPEGEKPYESPMMNINGLVIDKNIVKNAQTTEYGAHVTLENGTKLLTYSDNSGVVHKNQDGAVVYNGLGSSNIFPKKDSKNIVINSVDVSYYSLNGGGGDTLQVANCSNLDIFSLNGSVLMDTSHKPKSAPSLKDSRINGSVQNNLFWTENVKVAE